MKIALDIGNVLIRCDFEALLGYLFAKSGVVDKEEVFERLERVQASMDLGIVSFRQAIDSQFELDKVKLDKAVELWTSTVKPIEGMNNLLAYLSSKGHKIALVSNIGIDHAELIREAEEYSILNDYVQHFSCEVGARKPALLYFQSFLMAHSEFKGCIYVDDRSKNIEAGDVIGFDSRYFEITPELSDREVVLELAKTILRDKPDEYDKFVENMSP